jgi:hypothetical protein
VRRTNLTATSRPATPSQEESCLTWHIAVSHAPGLRDNDVVDADVDGVGGVVRGEPPSRRRLSASPPRTWIVGWAARNRPLESGVPSPAVTSTVETARSRAGRARPALHDGGVGPPMVAAEVTTRQGLGRAGQADDHHILWDVRGGSSSRLSPGGTRGRRRRPREPPSGSGRRDTPYGRAFRRGDASRRPCRDPAAGPVWPQRATVRGSPPPPG